MMDEHQWPTREEWARNRRTFYSDYSTDIDAGVTDAVDAYAAPEEIEAIIGALRSRWLELGRLMRRSTATNDPCEWGPYEQARDARTQVNRAIKSLRDGRLPRVRMYGCDVPELAHLHQRRQRVVEDREHELRRKIESEPIDDAAWEKELDQRRELEEWFANPALRITREHFGGLGRTEIAAEDDHSRSGN